MHTTDRENAFSLHQIAKHFLPGDDAYASLLRCQQFRIIRVERGHSRDDNECINISQVIGAMANEHAYSGPLQRPRGRGGQPITACDALASSLRHLRYRRDTLSPDTHEMQVQLFQMLKTSCFGRVVVSPVVILTTASTISWVACGLAKPRIASVIASKRAGVAIIA